MLANFKMSRALKEHDVLELSKLYEGEFNRPDLHDRVLIFDVVASSPRNENETSNPTSSQDEHVQIERETAENTTAKDGRITFEENEEVNGNAIISEDEMDRHDWKMDSEERKECQGIGKEDEAIKSATHDGNDRKHEKQDNANENSDESCKHIDASDEDEEKTLGKTMNDVINSERDLATNENQDIANENNENNCKKTVKLHAEVTENTGDKKSAADCKSSTDTKEDPPLTNEAINETELANVVNNKTTIIRQHQFYIHSSWLALQSSYFRSLFFSGMKESTSNEIHVQIAVFEEDAHLMLLKAMYEINVLDASSVDELLEVLLLAHKYDVRFVFKKCKYCLSVSIDSLEICEQIMRFIKKDNTITDVEDLASALQSFLAEEFSPLDKTWHTKSFTDLCEPSLRYLLSSNDLVTASENTVFHALVHWIEQCGLTSISNPQDLVSVVRFELIPMDYLLNIVQHNAIAKRLPGFSKHYLRGITYHATALSDELRRRLPHQPRQRKECAENPIAYTWVFSTDDLKKLCGTDQTLESNEFWYCGYKLVLTIDNVSEDENIQGEKLDQNYVVKKKHGAKARLHLPEACGAILGQKIAVFNTRVSLRVINLTQQSVVALSWKLQCASSQKDCIYDPEHTFTSNAEISTIDFKITSQSQASTPSVPTTAPLFVPAPSLGATIPFSFSSSSPTAFISSSPQPTLNFGTPSISGVTSEPSPSKQDKPSPSKQDLFIDLTMRLISDQFM